METIDILERTNRLHNAIGLQIPGSGNCTEDAVHRLLFGFVQAGNEGQQVVCGTSAGSW